MRNLYLKFQKMIAKDLNEYIKWVILIGSYLFYRMMEKAYVEEKLTFLVIPLVFLAILVFISDWIIDDLVYSTDRRNPEIKGKLPVIMIIAFLFYFSILQFILFYLTKWVPLINIGILSILSSAILARIKDNNTLKVPLLWNRWLGILLLLTGTTGMIYAIIYNNSLNVITFVFYIVILFYFRSHFELRIFNKGEK